MASESLRGTLDRLVEKMRSEYKESELEIAIELADAEDTLSIGELAERTGYTERTIKKRVETLEAQLRGPPLLQRDEDGEPFLHPELAQAIRESDAME